MRWVSPGVSSFEGSDVRYECTVDVVRHAILGDLKEGLRCVQEVLGTRMRGWKFPECGSAQILPADQIELEAEFSGYGTSLRIDFPQRSIARDDRRLGLAHERDASRGQRYREEPLRPVQHLHRRFSALMERIGCLEVYIALDRSSVIESDARRHSVCSGH